MAQVRTIFSGQLRAVDDASASVTAIVSTGLVARDGMIVLPSAWESHLASYRANPVLLWNHSSNANHPDAVIGRAEDIRVTPQGLQARIVYAVEANPTARMIFDLVRQGFLRAFSVFWSPRKRVTMRSGPAELAALPPYARQALMSGQATEVHTEAELLEISQVAVGADRDALVTAMRSLGAGRPAQGRTAKGTRQTDAEVLSSMVAVSLERIEMDRVLLDVARRHPAGFAALVADAVEQVASEAR